MNLFVDLDGVLADFDGAVAGILGVPSTRNRKLGNAGWKALARHPHLFSQLALLPDAMDLWRHVEPHDPIILTGLPVSMPAADSDKRAWVARHLGGGVRVITCASSQKCAHCEPGDLLVDDWEKYRHLWEQAGGRWLTHISAANSIEQLRAAL